MPPIRISELHIYPIKSARGISPASAHLDERGLQHDRRWMVVDERGHFLTQRKIPRMALIRVEIDAASLKVSTEGMPALLILLTPQSQDLMRVQVWEDSLDAHDVGEAAASWFTKMLGRPCRLVQMPAEAERFANPKYAPEQTPVGFADAFPLLLISQASLDELNTRLTEPVPMNRFRPNIVVEGCSPHEEDTWQTLHVGAITLRVAKPCSRCSVPTVDQDTGERGSEPIRTLESYRAFGGKVLFGQNLVHKNQGILRVGDIVLPTSR
jgi:uncharacterized protein YcbX